MPAKSYILFDHEHEALIAAIERDITSEKVKAVIYPDNYQSHEHNARILGRVVEILTEKIQ